MVNAGRLSQRGRVGVTPRPTTLEDESYMDFMEGVRNFAIGELFPRLGSQITAATQQQGFEGAGEDAPIEQVLQISKELPLSGAWQRVMRSQQQLTWNKLQDSFDSQRSEFEGALSSAEREGPGELSYDPSFEVPEYAKYPIHLQPGGYVGDSLAGYVFHHGTKVFYQGNNDQDELHRAVVEMTEMPADGKVSRILDVGCSIGQCTTALKEKFPKAEVWGLDVSLPLLRYAHTRAADMDSDVHFQHGLAEELPFPDGHFDAVLAYILFHEVPSRVFQPIVDEIYRVLRPGGVFSIVDAPNNTRLPAPNRLWQFFDARYNCEPYAPGFVSADFAQILDTAGFENLKEVPTPTFLNGTVVSKPN